MKYRNPMKKVAGLGSAHHGVNHWWMQRMTALALIPLSLWFVISLLIHTSGGYDAFISWAQTPFVSAVLIFFVSALHYHAVLGIQVVLEDYVHGNANKILGLFTVKFVLILSAVMSVVSILKIALGVA